MYRLLFVFIFIIFFSCGSNYSNVIEDTCFCQSNFLPNTHIGVFIYQDKVHSDSLQSIRNWIDQFYIDFAIINYDTHDQTIDLPHQDQIIHLLINKNVNVYIGLDLQYRVYWQEPNFFNQTWIDHQKQYIDWIYSKWRNQISGVYIPEEIDLSQPIKGYVNYVNQVCNYAHQKGYECIISPYWTKKSYNVLNEFYNVDKIFIQDGVGSFNHSIKDAEKFILSLMNQYPNVYPNIEAFQTQQVKPTNYCRVLQQIKFYNDFSPEYLVIFRAKSLYESYQACMINHQF